MTFLNRRVSTVSLLFLLLLAAPALWAGVGIVIYETKGVDVRRTSSGHIALIATNLCAEGIDQARVCRADEEPGIVISRYANLAAGYDRTVFVSPIRGHFMATAEADQIPVLSSGGTLNAMQIQYWRQHLRPSLPPLSQERYNELKAELDRFDAGRTFRKLISMELLIGILGPQKKTYPTEPIALIDPENGELIPNGRWREAIGTAHMRTSIIVTAPNSAEQEQRLIPYIEAVKKMPFQALTDNCSDFVEAGLVRVFSDAGLSFRPRITNVANAWITSPIEVATGFLNYAKRNDVPITVTSVPMLAGTRRPTAAITSIARGALVPTPSQGKMAFGMKIYFNTLNPLLGLTSFSADKLSRFADLKRLVHERGGGDLSRIASSVVGKNKPTDEDLKAWRREQVRVFGTTSCWQAKRDEFDRLTAQAKEVGALNAAERALLLKMGRPFLLPRLYEQTAAAQEHEGMLLVGMERTALSSVLVKNFLPPGVAREPQKHGDSGALVPGRPELLAMADSDQSGKRLLAFKLIASVINYDLSSEPIHRRNAAAFDQDWRLFLDVAQKNGLHLPGENPGGGGEALESCSCRQFDDGKANSDALAQADNFWRWLGRESRDTLYGPSR